MSPSQTINPPQPIPFIPMVPPLANTFSSTIHPSVTSALVDNLINNNPTPTTLSSGAPTTVTTSSAIPQAISQPSASESEVNANTSAINSLATNAASQLFISSPNPSNELIKSEQSVIQPPTSLPAFYQTPGAPQTSANQQFVQSEGEILSRHENNISVMFFSFLATPVPAYNVPMYNMQSMNQFNAPMQQPANYQTYSAPTDAQQKLEQAFSSPPMANYSAPDPNSNNQSYQQQFQPASAQFNMPSMPQIQTFEAYPQAQIQTQINLQGMPPLTVNTPRIDPTKYS